MPSPETVNAAHQLADLPGTVDVDGGALAIVCALFDVPIGTFNDVTITPDRVDPQVHTSVPMVDDIVPRMVPGIRDHPLFEPLASCRDVLRMSDVVSPRRWVQHPMYSEIIGPAGIPVHSVVIPVEMTTSYVFVMLNRDGDFRDDEVRDLTFLQGALTAMRRRDAVHSRAPISSGSPLTQREHEVLVLLDTGLTVSAVARQLVMQPRTAAKHIESIHKKLGTADRLSTVRLAERAGWLPRQR